MDKVTAAQEEYTRLTSAQQEIDTLKAEFEEKKVAAMQESNRMIATIVSLKEKRRANAERMAELRTFLDIAETI